MKKFLLSFLVTLVLLSGVSKFALADEVNVNLTVKNNGSIVYTGTIPLSLTLSENNVLSVIKQADILSPDFNISNIIHYSFGDYLKCITVSETTELCDNWLYKVNGSSPMIGMDSYALLGNENIVLYFGDEDKAPAPEPEPTPEPETPPAHSSSGSSGGRYFILNTTCEQGEKFSITTGRPCTSFIPSPLPVSPTITPPFLNTNLEEKPKDVLSTNPKKQTKKISKITKQDTAAIVNSVPFVSVQTETPKKSWFRNFLDKIFSVF
jgi:hypothetical protein